jgi:hypothetical protein
MWVLCVEQSVGLDDPGVRLVLTGKTTHDFDLAVWHYQTDRKLAAPLRHDFVCDHAPIWCERPSIFTGTLYALRDLPTCKSRPLGRLRPRHGSDQRTPAHIAAATLIVERRSDRAVVSARPEAAPIIAPSAQTNCQMGPTAPEWYGRSNAPRSVSGFGKHLGFRVTWLSVGDRQQRMRQPSGSSNFTLGDCRERGPLQLGPGRDRRLLHRYPRSVQDVGPADATEEIGGGRGESCRHADLQRLRQPVGVTQMHRARPSALRLNGIDRVGGTDSKQIE